MTDIAAGSRRALIFLFAVSLVLGGLNLLFTAHEVNASQHNWCTTLDLLSARPVAKPANPAANPSREGAYVFYTDIQDLRRHFGCG